jgi:TolA-binding protein
MALLAVSLAPALGCGAPDVNPQAIHTLQGDLARLRAENGALAERLEALELRAGVFGPRRELPDLMAPPLGGEGQPDLQVVRLVPAGAPSAKANADDERTVLRSSGKGVVMDSSASQEDRKELASHEFDRAEAMFTAKKYDAALVAYAGFVVRFPEDPRAATATIRRGECFFHKGNHARAIEQLEAGLAAKPPGERAESTLAMLVKAHEAVGDAAGAARARERFGAAPPKTPPPSSSKKP